MIYLLIVSVLWSMSFGLIKSQVSGLDPFVVSAIRLGFSALIFAPFLRHFKAKLVFELIIIGLIQFGLMYCAYIASYKILAGHQIALLTTTTPIFVALIALAIAKRWHFAPILAAFIAVIGAIVIVYNPAMLKPTLMGLVLVQLSNICFAAGQIWYRNARKRHGLTNDISAFGWLYIGALIAPIAFLLLNSTNPVLPHTGAQWASLAYLGLIPSALGFYLWNKGVTQVSSGTAATMNNLKIPGAVILAWLIFNETINLPRVIISIVLMAAALWLAHEPQKNKQAALKYNAG
ncbi:MAG: EamA family transporter [Deltaproteobacteria bacterium]|nr:EamA family transporter [Deltaproteobacteria bacterium]